MNKDIGFDIDGKKTVACVVQKGEKCTMRRAQLLLAVYFKK